MQARAIAEKFVLKKPPPGESYRTVPCSDTTNPIGHPTRHLFLFLNPAFNELMEDELMEDLKDVARVLARNDLFKVQRDFLEEQATRRDHLGSLQGCGGGRPA